MVDTHSNPQKKLMSQARSQTSFDVHRLVSIIYGDEGTVRRRREAWARVEARTGAADTSRLPRQYTHTSREDLYWDGLDLGRASWEDRKKFQHDFFDWLTPRYTLFNYLPFGLSTSMFTYMLKLMATPEQQTKWLRPAVEGKINGCYVQTELGHGTFVRGLETTAHFDVTKDCFVLNTPTLTSTKFWPGALGFAATHGIVMARLIIKEKDFGIHAFLVQLRDTDTGYPEEGIELGDIGPKLSHNQNDNGYARFKNLTVSRQNMLMAHASVARDGTFSKRPGVNAKSAYATMMLTRSRMVWVAGVQLAAATTIATRYSTVRQQGDSLTQGTGHETALIQYRSQNYRLLTRLAQAYAILFASRRCESVHREFEQRQKKGDFSTMQATHALMATMKAWSTDVAAAGAEDGRRCCGGHGYLATSGLPEIVESVAVLCTGEGDNHVLFQQTARYLLKFAVVSQTTTPPKEIPDELRYLVSKDVEANMEFVDPNSADMQLLLFRQRAQGLLAKAHRAVKAETDRGRSREWAWNQHVMLLMSLAKAHAEYLALRSFVAAVEQTTDLAVGRVLNRLRSLFALALITSDDTGTFAGSAFLTGDRLESMRAAINDLLDALLPDAIGLTDAWDFTDGGLASAIGMKDGNVYETLMSWTEQLPINVKAREEGGKHKRGWEQFIAPALSSKL
ncbi:acyl-CoA oxidase [Xylariomycetidae sp. FL2044]|nr:acyl-CoA oxidase [Xylariomycetidae sp. FL2044]